MSFRNSSTRHLNHRRNFPSTNPFPSPSTAHPAVTSFNPYSLTTFSDSYPLHLLLLCSAQDAHPRRRGLGLQGVDREAPRGYVCRTRPSLRVSCLSPGLLTTDVTSSSDADPEVLADYVLALLANDSNDANDESKAEAHVLSEIEPFLKKGTFCCFCGC